jgi:2,4-dienoyl-CoA reductase [(3E)-enoyl-CoA-producing], peroxisomal
LDIDVQGSYNATKVCLPHLLDSVKKHNSQGGLPKSLSTGPGGRIIYVSATLHYTGTPLQTHAAVAKAGVDALSNNVAIEYGPFGITANVVSPGPIADTEGVDRLAGKPKESDRPGSYIPLGRWGSVKEIADATVWLFSDAANYVTGQITVVDGGAWRTQSGAGGAFAYPDFLVSRPFFPLGALHPLFRLFYRFSLSRVLTTLTAIWGGGYWRIRFQEEGI